jgi:CheY-like chemotaxis protein
LPNSGRFRDELGLGRRVVDLIIPPHLRDTHLRGLNRYLTTGEARILGTRVEILEQREKPALHGAFTFVPAIAFSAHASEHDRQRARQAGFDAHVAKPADPAALVGAVRDVLGRPASPPT